MTVANEDPRPLEGPAKVDPETLALRGRPRPAVRFKKGVIVGGVAGLCAILSALAWLALEPANFRFSAEESGRPFERKPGDVLAGAPRDYRDVPVLGPPLPGDLGRPILEHQREAGIPIENIASGPSAVEVDALQGQQRRIAAEEAARGSPVLVDLSRPSPLAKPADDVSAEPPAGTRTADAVAPAVVEGRLGDWDTNSVNPYRLMAAPSPWTIAAGTIIPASLITGINSDLPGMVIAQVTQNVRDSALGQEVLIPQGARLLGRYESEVRYGQQRAFVVWQRLLFPDGSSLRLDNMPASDGEGFAGLADRVDGHGWQLAKGVLFSSLLGVGSQLSLGAQSGLERAVRESLQRNGNEAGERIVSKGLDVQPTIRVRAGWPVHVLVSEDLVLEPWRG